MNLPTMSEPVQRWLLGTVPVSHDAGLQPSGTCDSMQGAAREMCYALYSDDYGD